MSAVFDAAKGVAVQMRARLGRGTSAQGFYAQRLRFRDLAFDVGANLGHHTRAMLKRGARVVALEPQAELARELADAYPAATVLPVGVSDHVGEARLTTSTTHKHLATMNPGFSHESFDSATTIPITTLDELIAEFGCPALVKVDTEGHDDKVFAGLSQPIDQVLFEVHSALPTVAAGCFERLAELGQYEYRLTVHRPDGESWVFGPPVTDSAVLAELPDVGDVYARRIR